MLGMLWWIDTSHDMCEESVSGKAGFVGKLSKSKTSPLGWRKEYVFGSRNAFIREVLKSTLVYFILIIARRPHSDESPIQAMLSRPVELKYHLIIAFINLEIPCFRPRSGCFSTLKYPPHTWRWKDDDRAKSSSRRRYHTSHEIFPDAPQFNFF